MTVYNARSKLTIMNRQGWRRLQPQDLVPHYPNHVSKEPSQPFRDPCITTCMSWVNHQASTPSILWMTPMALFRYSWLAVQIPVAVNEQLSRLPEMRKIWN